MVKEKLDPATLYIYRHGGKVVAIAIGNYPPDPLCWYDSLMRVPIVTNGHRPRWRSFVWYQQETINTALRRSRWPGEPEDEDA